MTINIKLLGTQDSEFSDVEYYLLNYKGIRSKSALQDNVQSFAEGMLGIPFSRRDVSLYVSDTLGMFRKDGVLRDYLDATYNDWKANTLDYIDIEIGGNRMPDDCELSIGINFEAYSRINPLPSTPVRYRIELKEAV